MEPVSVTVEITTETPTVKIMSDLVEELSQSFFQQKVTGSTYLETNTLERSFLTIIPTSSQMPIYTCPETLAKFRALDFDLLSHYLPLTNQTLILLLLHSVDGLLYRGGWFFLPRTLLNEVKRQELLSGLRALHETTVAIPEYLSDVDLGVQPPVNLDVLIQNFEIQEVTNPDTTQFLSADINLFKYTRFLICSRHWLEGALLDLDQAHWPYFTYIGNQDRISFLANVTQAWLTLPGIENSTTRPKVLQNLLAYVPLETAEMKRRFELILTEKKWRINPCSSFKVEVDGKSYSVTEQSLIGVGK